MAIRNRDDAVEVEERVERIFGASTTGRAGEIRGLFAEVLDFEPDFGDVSLAGASGTEQLPASAERVAVLDDVYVLHVALSTDETDRVRKREADAAARLIGDQLGDELLLVFTNTSASQLHFVHPSFKTARPTLRRIIVERDLPHRTAVQQVSSIYWNFRESDSIRAALEEAFDVEPVTREFFREYKRIFDAANDRVTGFGQGDEEDKAKQMFVQTLFNRLMFIYFLQRKGWLEFQGDNDYLNALWKNYRASEDQTNFYEDRLVPLFFEGLNNPQSPESRSNDPELYSVIGAPPFLNGGLFDETDLDGRSDLDVPDDAIGPILSDLFGRFNFTVMESTPFDIEVAVDPEMLGKVFEELVIERNESGAYYTPRPVVSFMCREALKGYLEGQDTGLSTEAIGAFVDDRDTTGIPLPTAHRVSQALDDVTVVDPACGSGAYLLGMLQELVDLQTALYSEQLRTSARDMYDLKLHIIQRNLYGADIDEFAVNIAMLRLWLSLAIEYEGDDPDPLPNLDFKIVQGDSLLGPDPDLDSYGDLFRHQVHTVAERLTDLKRQHIEAVGAAKDSLREDIEKVHDDLAAALADSPASEEAVDWRVEFAEVFDRGGFDIALANPPYIQLQKDEGKLGNLYKDVGYETFIRTGDVYQLFFERGCQLLRSSYGLLAYITSNSWLRAKYGERLRRYFSDNYTPLSLLDLGKDVFDSAIVDSSILLLRSGGANGAFRAVDMDKAPASDFPPDDRLWGQVRPSAETPWSILSRPEQRVMDKMLAVGTPLEQWDVQLNYGIKTGYNKAFIIDTPTRDMLVKQDSISHEIIKPLLRGQDIKRFRAKWAGKWLIATLPALDLDIDDYPAVRDYLMSFGKDRLEQSGKRLPGGGRSRKRTQHAWFELQDTIAYHKEFCRERLFWMDMSPQGRFAYSDTEGYCNDKGFIMTGESLKYLCAILNSTLITWLMNHTALTTGMGLLQWKKFTVERLPIPKVTTLQQRPFIGLVDAILEAKAAVPEADTSHLEWKIDRLVYDLYGLTEEEDTAIERSLGLIHATDEEEDAAMLKWMLEANSDAPDEFVSEEAVMATLRDLDGD